MIVRVAVIAIALSAVIVTTPRAQSTPTGAIAGTITDTSGKSVFPGVTVTLFGPAPAKSVTTNSSGRFRFEGLAPGTYRLETKLHGFIPQTKTVSVVDSKEVTVAFALQILPRNGKPVEKFVEELTGPDALDCGRHKPTPIEAALRVSLDCALKAAREMKPFHTICEYNGIDSQIREGLLGAKDGVVYRFTYDSAPCGGPACDPRFEATPCVNPSATGSPVGARFTCRR